ATMCHAAAPPLPVNWNRCKNTLETTSFASNAPTDQMAPAHSTNCSQRRLLTFSVESITTNRGPYCGMGEAEIRSQVGQRALLLHELEVQRVRRYVKQQTGDTYVE